MNRITLGFLAGVGLGMSGCNLVHTTLWDESTTGYQNYSTPEIVLEGEYFVKAPVRGAHEENHWDINNDGWYSWKEDDFVAFSKTSDLGYEGGLRRLRNEKPFSP